MSLRSSAPLFSFIVVLAGCASSPGTPSDHEATASTREELSSTLALPQGLTCGLWHTGGPLGVGCEEAGPGGTSTGYDFIGTGDLGMPAGQGFFHNALFVSTPPAASYGTDTLPLPRGVDCGLRHTGSTVISPTCLGFNAEVACPTGWAQRIAYDHEDGGVSTQNFWAWCEYQDIHGLCPRGACVNNVPWGTVCGLGYSVAGSAVGLCEGKTVEAQGCPKGWTLEGPRDEGALSGQGLLWCTRGGTVAVKPPKGHCDPNLKICF